MFSAVSPGTYVIPVKILGSDLSALASKALAFTQRGAWKVTGFDYLVAGTSSPSVVMSLLVGEGGSAMTGAEHPAVGRDPGPGDPGPGNPGPGNPGAAGGPGTGGEVA